MDLLRLESPCVAHGRGHYDDKSRLHKSGFVSDQAQLADGVTFADELGGGGVDLAAAVVVDLESLNDLLVAVAAHAREPRDDALRHAVAAVDGTPIDTQSPSGVPSAHERMWSTAALAADAADDAPRALMIAPPRVATVGMYVVVDPRMVADRFVGVACRRPRNGTGRGTGCSSGCPRSSSS